MLFVAIAVLLVQSSTPVQCKGCSPDTQALESIQTIASTNADLPVPESPTAAQEQSAAPGHQTENRMPDSQPAASGETAAFATPIARAASTAFPVTPARPAVVITQTATERSRHRFMDKTNLIGAAVHAAVRITDATQTCVLLGRPGRREAWLPIKSCGGIAAYSLSMVPAQVTSSYLFHRSGHHKLERWLPYMWAAPSAAGIGVSIRSW